MKTSELIVASKNALSEDQLASVKSIVGSPELLTEYIRQYKLICESPEYEFSVAQKEQLARYHTLLTVMYKELVNDMDAFVYEATSVDKDGNISTSKRLHPKTKLVELISMMELNITNMLKEAKKKVDTGDREREIEALMVLTSNMSKAVAIDAEFSDTAQ